MSKHRIGYACIPMSIPYRTTRRMNLKDFNTQGFIEKTGENINDLLKILEWNHSQGITMFRISSDIIPFGSHPINTLAWDEMFEDVLSQCGEFVKQSGMRVSMHPGQYTVLNSPDEGVVERSIADLEYHCRFLDALGIDDTHKLILHVGGVYGDKEAAMKRFIANYPRLSQRVQSRLILENDERSYTIAEVLDLCRAVQMPAVFDNLHDAINPSSLQLEEVLSQVRQTWKPQDGPVKFHYSDQDPNKQRGAHSQTIDTRSFLAYMKTVDSFDCDIMLEVKDKELSVLKLNPLLREQRVHERTSLWARYKYRIMETGYANYKRCSAMINDGTPLDEIVIFMDACLELPFDAGSFRNTADHVYGYVRKQVSDREKQQYMLLVEDVSTNAVKIKKLLSKLMYKYDEKYVLDSVYFAYTDVYS
ncbi:UV DNA damage repair endonuclease UvsE [Erysipelothrix sp. HDW6C]|uniref:UV DNA damage repair endonuclease UvsE n=1 Tax=Erysipelothrix sp. HDW6C TaxID=2714930 RepID=UPI00140A7DF0|nr:UV DNA damage repair endonuclease UvsE [Erysipelothrix sp. HDW6C]QIK69314.1 UV DNA damage repair endonuclease UvsE [Erysipelothrix sp. HDW6C]